MAFLFKSSSSTSNSHTTPSFHNTPVNSTGSQNTSSSLASSQPCVVPIKYKTPIDLINQFHEALKSSPSSDDILQRCIVSLKISICDDIQNNDNNESESLICDEFINRSLFLPLVKSLPRLAFEIRKDAYQILIMLLRSGGNISIDSPMALHIAEVCPNVLEELLLGYFMSSSFWCRYSSITETGLLKGMLLRECLKQECLATLFLSSKLSLTANIQEILNFNIPTSSNDIQEQCYNVGSLLDLLLEFIKAPNYDISSDAFATLKDLLTRHRQIISAYLEQNYEKIIDKLHSIIVSTNYLTKRQTLKLVGEMLLDRSNYDVMSRYITCVPHMKLMMSLLRDKSKNLQYESFQIFKLFIANPSKPKPIIEIISNNKEKLLAFLNNFDMNFTGSELNQFTEEKSYLISQVEALPSKKPIATNSVEE